MQYTWRSSWQIGLKKQVTTKARRCKPSLRLSMRLSREIRTSVAYYSKSNKLMMNTSERQPSETVLKALQVVTHSEVRRMHWSDVKNWRTK
jgi:hypothetical protein